METFEGCFLKSMKRCHCGECAPVGTFRFEDPRELRYKAGQYFIVEIPVDGKQLRHHFSFSSSPTEKGYLEFTTRIRDSEFKNGLARLEEGDVAWFRAPFGRFVLEENLEKIGMLSGGIGITPLRSICRYCTDRRLSVDIVLLFGNHREEDILFRDEFSKMQTTNPNLRVEYTILEPSESWKGYTGYIDADMIRDEMPDYLEREFYVCGPPPMTKSMEEILFGMNVVGEKIKKESFAGYNKMFS